ncbi:MAG: DNA topoisomerase 3 [Myxococcales bacterium]|nr:DNA topoisomerase 3 [Myxococcales bacterium]
MQVVIAEKPSVARDIAAVLGASTRRKGYLQGAGYAVTWALGHLVALPEPHEIDPSWKKWSAAQLPMLPERWPLVVLDRGREQYEVVDKLLNDARTESIVCATDAGREGELIFRHIMERTGCTRPVKRLWISSLTPDAIRRGFDNLEDGAAYDDLAAAARGRSRADWLVGMNLSRAYTLALNDTLSVGRVQTPTLAMLVARDREIRDFVPEDYLELWVKLPRESDSKPDAPEEALFEARYMASAVGREALPLPRPGGKTAPKSPSRPARLPADGERAKLLLKRLAGAELEVLRADVVPSPQRPELLYDLTELQRHANRQFGWSAQHTLELAQQLYEKHKLISYPRSDSRHLSTEAEAELPGVLQAVAPAYRSQLPPELFERIGRGKLGKRFVDDARVSDHHAIIPTDRASKLASGGELHRLYDLICRRLLQAFLPDYQSVNTTQWFVRSAGTPDDESDLFRARGKVVKDEGFRRLDPPGSRRKSSTAARTAGDFDRPLPDLSVGQRLPVIKAGTDKRRTQPPRRHDEATLLTAMETAGRTLDDRALSDAMRERGLGTAATRAAIIENLLSRGYVERDGKQLCSTDKGERLIDSVHEQVRSPAMTGEWEYKLKGIERGQGELGEFLGAIERYVAQVVGTVLASEPTPAHGGAPSDDNTALATTRPAPRAPQLAPRGPADTALFARLPARPDITASSEGLETNLRRVFGHDGFRPNQLRVCEQMAAGDDVLLVMPTGAGKSICYQLPALSRPGTALVISPLIALMEDQVEKLQALGLRAERIHSGRDRAHSRRVCRAYLDGHLDYLFIAPERLRVPGFGPMLARRPLSLVAIDEAHCISEWGHDFRPDYRMLRERLPELGKAPIIALTATATGRVQADILEQLGIAGARRAVHGFRRDNIAVEIVEMPQGTRDAALLGLLSDRRRLPAIVYSPSRKGAEASARALGKRLSAMAYHAGMNPEQRERAQSRFLLGKLDVIVATTAFGMGVDKADVRTVVHMALPGSVEGYYQEIGRAGRDGQSSRAVLLHSYGDRKTHEFFFERDYPSPTELGRLHKLLGEQPQRPAELAHRLGWDGEKCERAVEKLWAHGGAQVDHEGGVIRGAASWRKPYQQQRVHRQDQLERMTALAESSRCRMLQLVEHFGDQADSGRPCGQCDICDPEAVVVAQHRAPSDTECSQLRVILTRVAQDTTPPAMGTLFRDTLEGQLDRRSFETLATALCRARLTLSLDDSFEKDGKQIAFRRLCRGADWSRGKVPSAAELKATVKLPADYSGAADGARAQQRPKRRRKSTTKGSRKRSSATPSKIFRRPAPKKSRQRKTAV